MGHAHSKSKVLCPTQNISEGVKNIFKRDPPFPNPKMPKQKLTSHQPCQDDKVSTLLFSKSNRGESLEKEISKVRIKLSTMKHRPYFTVLLLHLLIILLHPRRTLALQPSCQDKCGSLPVKYPLGTGYGCGSPRFHPHVSCSPAGDKLLFTTHTGSYPITSISYATSTLTITPPYMSTCSSMQSSPNFGLDWPSPFQLGPSIFLLLSCAPPTSSLTVKGTSICDSTYAYLCASMYTCPAVVSLGLSLFAPTNTCCVYSPSNLNTKGDLDLQALRCAGYASVVALGDFPTDPSLWEYGVTLKYNEVGSLDTYSIAASCEACEKSDGVCGYAPPRNNFVCVCKNGFNSSVDCFDQVAFWSSVSMGTKTRRVWLGWLVVLSFLTVA